jgi:hypothetical protein
MGISKFERFFRIVAGLDIDKADLQRYNKLINQKLRDLPVRGEEVARVNGRHIIEPSDLPITKGLQECIDAFKQLNEAIPLAPILAHLAATPPLELGNSDETEAQLPSIAGGLSVALARSFTIIDPRSEASPIRALAAIAAHVRPAVVGVRLRRGRLRRG